jgi:hypothetical protein
MDYAEAYEDLQERLLAALAKVDSEESSREFCSEAEREIRNLTSTVSEFYVGEFLNLFKDAAVEQGRAEVAAYEAAQKDTSFEADLATVELNARLTAAQAAGDRDAVHAVWREREERQAALRARKDALRGPVDTLGFRLDAVKSLGSEFGFDFG